MTVKERWSVAGMIGFPLLAMTCYLARIWPQPNGTSVIAQIGPYLVSLLTGLPFVWVLTRQSGRWMLMVAFLAGGFAVLWLYALAMLCAVKGVCL